MNRAFYDVRYNTTYEDIIDDILYQYVTEWDGAFLLTLREVPGQILIYAYGNKAAVGSSPQVRGAPGLSYRGPDIRVRVEFGGVLVVHY